MTSIIFVRWKTYLNQFKRNYLINKKLFWFFFFFAAFLMFTLNFEHLWKKDNFHNSCISGIPDFEWRGLDKYLKHRVSENPSRVNIKYFVNAKNFFWIYSCSSQIYIKFWFFWKKKKKENDLMYFQNYQLTKTWLHKCLKGSILEHRLTLNMLKGPKHYKNTQESTFIIYFHQSVGSYVIKCLS